MFRTTVFVTVLLSLVAIARPALSQDGVEAVEPIERTHTGRYACTQLDDGNACGSEDWIMTVQGDGTRTLRAYSYVSPITFQNSSIMRVDQNFRPLDGFVNLYRGGKFFGSGFYIVKDSKLAMTVHGAEETFSEEIDIPVNTVLLIYPNSAYGWMLGAYDREEGGVQIVTMCVLAATGRSASCALVEEPIEYVGEETITVPAGTFETAHFKIGKNGDTWIKGEDRVVIQHQHRVRNLRFQLTTYDERE